jgi:hypothetical protein
LALEAATFDWKGERKKRLVLSASSLPFEDQGKFQGPFGCSIYETQLPVEEGGTPYG